MDEPSPWKSGPCRRPECRGPRGSEGHGCLHPGARAQAAWSCRGPRGESEGGVGSRALSQGLLLSLTVCVLLGLDLWGPITLCSHLSLWVGCPSLARPTWKHMTHRHSWGASQGEGSWGLPHIRFRGNFRTCGVVSVKCVYFACEDVNCGGQGWNVVGGMSVPPNSYTKANPQCEGRRRWGL